MANGDLSSSIAPPIPDPTVLTTEQLLRTAQAERDYVDGRIEVLTERLAGMDRATELLSETVNRVPTETQREVQHLAGLMSEKFASVANQFAERDTRSEREARDNKLAVDAAFAAQEKQAVAQNDANTTAINKSEQATTETINKLAELFETRVGALAENIGDLKERTQALESGGRGQLDASHYAQGERQIATSSQQASAAHYALIAYMVIGTLALILTGVALAIHG